MDKIETLLLRRTQLWTEGIKKYAEKENEKYEQGLFFHGHRIHGFCLWITFNFSPEKLDVNCFLRVIVPDHQLHFIPLSGLNIKVHFTLAIADTTT